LTALTLAAHPKGEENAALDAMMDLWESIQRHHFYKNWVFGIPEGFISKSGIYDSSPQVEFIHNVLEQYTQFYRKLSIGITDANTGTSKSFSILTLHFQAIFLLFMKIKALMELKII
jgi:hypothetical protein